MRLALMGTDSELIRKDVKVFKNPPLFSLGSLVCLSQFRRNSDNGIFYDIQHKSRKSSKQNNFRQKNSEKARFGKQLYKSTLQFQNWILRILLWLQKLDIPDRHPQKIWLAHLSQQI